MPAGVGGEPAVDDGAGGGAGPAPQQRGVRPHPPPPLAAGAARGTHAGPGAAQDTLVRTEKGGWEGMGRMRGGQV